MPPVKSRLGRLFGSNPVVRHAPRYAPTGHPDGTNRPNPPPKNYTTTHTASAELTLLKDKHATLALTSGVYAGHVASPAFGIDHHSAYLRGWLNQAGVTAIEELRFQPSLLTEDPVGDLAHAQNRAVELARAHGRICAADS